jgi:carboxyl-terminal processing protease
MSIRKLLNRFLFVFLLFSIDGGPVEIALGGPARTSDATTTDMRAAVAGGGRLERSRQWLGAIEHYRKSLKLWPDNKQLQHGLRRSKIHFGIDRRYVDDSFEHSLLGKSQGDALLLFDETISRVNTNYVEPISVTSFLAHGTESFYLALGNQKFLDRNLRGVDKDRVARIRRILRKQYWNKPVADRWRARATVIEVCDIAYSLLGLTGGPIVMEYVFGGCNALDDYSNYLTPDRLEDLYGNIDGEFVGLGIEMKAETGKGLLLVNVLPDSPAADGGLIVGDYIVKIDETDCRQMTTDEAARFLRGPTGSTVLLDVQGPSADAARQQVFTRRSVQVKSIPVVKMIDRRNGIAYIRMTGFQKTSATEMDAALRSLHEQGMRALVWDLRGNPGGLLNAAVEVLDRFIDDGVLVSTRGRTRDQNWSYSAHRPGTWNVPLVLLVDGQSASASEIVAGAVDDHGRGVIVGRTTYGKWSVQSIFLLRNSTGLRLTTAKFYSPHGRSLGKIGVEPDVIVKLPQDHQTNYRANGRGLEGDADILKGLEILRRQITRR